MTTENILDEVDFAIKHGFDIWVDPRIPLNHIGDYDFGIDAFKAYTPNIDDKEKESMVDLCQDTNLYAELATALRKSAPQSQSGPKDLFVASGVGEKPDETTRESKLTQESSGDGTSQK